MNMKVVSFLSALSPRTLQPKHANSEKVLALKYFAQGVSTAGDTAQISTLMQYEPCDVAVILGWVHEHGKVASHLQFRQHIIDQQRQRRGRTVIIDSNLFLYKDHTNPGHRLRYSFDGVFPDTGEYCDSIIDQNKWKIIQQDSHLQLKPWRVAGSHILLCLQRNGGWSMGGFDVIDWVTNTVAEIRKYTNRPIRLRPHPGDKHAISYVEQYIKKSQSTNISISNVGSQLTEDLIDCWAVVNYNSSPAVGAAIEGVPIFVTDAARSQCREIAITDLSQIENPVLLNRQPWIERISQFHWNFAELQSGACWQHMRKFV